MSNCVYFQEQIELDLDGELSTAERNELNKHLSVCLDCRKIREESLALWGALESGLQLDPPGDLPSLVAGRLARRRVWRLAGFAAMLLIAALSSLPFLSQGTEWVLTALLDLDLGWIPKFFGTIWSTTRVIYKGFTLLAESLPQEYWLGLAAVVAIDLALVVKVFGPRLTKGGSVA